GAFFTSAGLVIVAYSDHYGARESSGYLIAIWSFGSGVAALAMGSIKWRRSASRRFIESVVTLFLLTIPIYLAAILAPGNFLLMGAVLFINGLAVAPMLTSSLPAAERSVPESRKTEVLAWAISAMNFGGALPPAITGYIIDNQGVSVAFAIPLICMALSAILILPYLKLWREKVREIPA
ncbi:MAG: MFS transporter, partial [Actinomycetota bacterium]